MAGDEVAARMTKIMRIFIQGQSIAENGSELVLIGKQLNEIENEYRSVAFEAASMAIAISDFESGAGLKLWSEFNKKYGGKHASQIHSGLGWAIALKGISLTDILVNIEPLMQYRVADGCGYYEGIFRQQSALKNKLIPDTYSKYPEGYDQGIGRSVYYSAKGDIEKIPGIINEFPETRQADLWRGVAIACVYVGGCDEKMLNRIFDLSGRYYKQLQVGAALVSRARHDAESVTPYVESACKIWCHSTFSEVIAITSKTESATDSADGAYKKLMNAIIQELSPISTGIEK
ncbi:MAG: DUF1702 family protein [Bacteroidetes bacterium]|nr:DUF1702 family protein [Bacteroidota bacterium]